MSDTEENIDGAAGAVDRLIERFGGIRPMAAKLDIPVTTVQGWKKRSALPAARHADIVAAAEKNGISLDGIDLAAAEQPVPDSEPSGLLTRTGSAFTPGGLLATGIGLISFLSLILVLAGLYIVKQKTGDLSHRVNIIEQGFVADQKLQARLDALEKQPHVDDGAAPASTVLQLQQRIADLGAQVSQLSTLSQKVVDLQAASGNRDALAQTVSGLQQTVATLQGSVQSLSQTTAGEQTHMAQLDTEMGRKRQENARQFAVILALNQLRAAATTGEPFETELTAAKRLAGDDTDMTQQLEVLAAYSTDGAPTLNDLRTEFADKASEIVRSNVVGDGKSWRRQALYHLSSVISIRRIGTQAKDEGVSTTDILVSRAESKLEEDDLAGAVEALQGLDGLPKDISASWVDSAQRRVAVDGALAALSDLSIKRLSAYETAGDAGHGSNAQ